MESLQGTRRGLGKDRSVQGSGVGVRIGVVISARVNSEGLVHISQRTCPRVSQTDHVSEHMSAPMQVHSKSKGDKGCLEPCNLLPATGHRTVSNCHLTIAKRSFAQQRSCLTQSQIGENRPMSRPADSFGTNETRHQVGDQYATFGE